MVIMESKRGRPELPEGQGAEGVFQIRLSSEEKALWKSAAERAGMKLAAWMKDRLGKAVKRECRSGHFRQIPDNE